jgi:hypothetical protein
MSPAVHVCDAVSRAIREGHVGVQPYPMLELGVLPELRA